MFRLFPPRRLGLLLSLDNCLHSSSRTNLIGGILLFSINVSRNVLFLLSSLLPLLLLLLLFPPSRLLLPAHLVGHLGSGHVHYFTWQGHTLIISRHGLLPGGCGLVIARHI